MNITKNGINQNIFIQNFYQFHLNTGVLMPIIIIFYLLRSIDTKMLTLDIQLLIGKFEYFQVKQ
jgi:hypothetical protein